MRLSHFLALGALALSSTAQGQALQPELRVDVIGPPPLSIEPGVGLNAAFGQYVRVSAGAGYEARGLPERAGRRWRGDLMGRVTLDPFRQQRWALGIGGGLSYRGSATYLAAIVDLEGPETRGLLPALQVGVSGGIRAGFVLRRAVRGRR